jgi:hypothetical protein
MGGVSTQKAFAEPKVLILKSGEVVHYDTNDIAQPDPNWEKVYTPTPDGKESTDGGAYGIAELDPASKPLPRPAMVTDSFAERRGTSNGMYYYAAGYATVMNGENPYYHYTTVTLEKGDTTLVTSGRVYGTGKVSAETGYIDQEGNSSTKAHVYYGWE